MGHRKQAVTLTRFDAVDYLTDDASMAEYLTAALETGDNELLLLALADVARARGVSETKPAQATLP